MLGGIISSAIGGVIDNTIGQMNARKLASQQLAHQKELAAIQHGYQLEYMDKSYDQQLDFWNQQNEYNLPTAQRQRLEDANYNVMDIARQGGAVNTAGQLSPMSTPQAGAGSASMAINQAAGIAESASRIRLNEAMADEASAQAGKARGETVGEGTQQRYVEALTRLTENQALGSEVSTEANKFKLEMDKLYASEEREVGLKTAKESLDKLTAETLAQMNKNSIFGYERDKIVNDLFLQCQEYELMVAETALKHRQAQFTEEQYNHLHTMLPYLVNSAMNQAVMEELGKNVGAQQVLQGRGALRMQEQYIERQDFYLEKMGFSWWYDFMDKANHDFKSGMSDGAKIIAPFNYKP